MSEAPEKPGEAGTPTKKGRAGLLVGLVAAVVLGGGGYYAVSSGLFDPTAVLGSGRTVAHGGGHGEAAASLPADTAFVPLDPIAISLAPGANARLLRFSGQLEVAPDSAAEVAGLMPRVVDVLNTYLRAVEVRDLEEPAALVRLRAQMLRRVQVVTGEGRVRDLLITEFVLG
jgi:flagellar protein FliL